MEKKKGRNLMVTPKDGNVEKLTNAKLWFTCRGIKYDEITISIAIPSNSKQALSARLTLWDRILFKLTFWNKFESEKIWAVG